MADSCGLETGTPDPASADLVTPGPAAPESCAPGTKQRGPRLLCPSDLPGVSLAVAHIHPAAQPRHVHDSLILGVVTAGARRIRTSAGETRIGAGDLYAAPIKLLAGLSKGYFSLKRLGGQHD